MQELTSFIFSRHVYHESTLRFGAPVEASPGIIRKAQPTFLERMIGPLSYIGGKRALAKRIIELFPKHTTYAEVFAGGAQVFFAKEPSKVEVLNDRDGEIANFFRICQSHYEELVRYLRFMLVSRTWFELLRKTDPATLTDIQRAARYFYLLKGSFASLIVHPNYHWHVVQPPGFNP